MLHNFNLTKETVHKRILYSSIAHSVSVSKFPDFSYEQSWDGNNFSIQDGSGTRGTISFFDNQIVGAFRHDRNFDRNKIDAEVRLNGASDQIISYAKSETLQYLLDNMEGVVKPIITTAFFSQNNEIYSNDNLEDFKILTDNLIDFMFLSDEENEGYWEEQYEFSEKEIEIIEKLYQLKLANLEDKVEVPKEMLSDLDFVSEEARHEVKASLAELNMALL